MVTRAGTNDSYLCLGSTEEGGGEEIQARNQTRPDQTQGMVVPITICRCPRLVSVHHERQGEKRQVSAPAGNISPPFSSSGSVNIGVTTTRAAVLHCPFVLPNRSEGLPKTVPSSLCPSLSSPLFSKEAWLLNEGSGPRSCVSSQQLCRTLRGRPIRPPPPATQRWNEN